MAAADEQLPSVNKPEESDAASPTKNNDGKASTDEAEKDEAEPTEEPVTAQNGRTSRNGENLESSSGSKEASSKSISIPESQSAEKMDVDEVKGDSESDQRDLDAKAASPAPATPVEPMESDSGENKPNSSEATDTKSEPCSPPQPQSEQTQDEAEVKEDTSAEVDSGDPVSPKPETEPESPEKSVEEANDDLTIVKAVTKENESTNGTVAKSRRKDAIPESLTETSEDGAMDNQGRRRSLRIRSSSSKKYTEEDIGEEDADCIPLDPPAPSPAKDPLMVSKKALIVPAKPSKPTFRVGDIPLPKSISMTPVSLKKESPAPPQVAVQTPPASSSHAGFVIIDTTSLLAGKGPVAVSTITPSPATPPVVLNPPPNPVRLVSSNKTPSSKTKIHPISPASTSATPPSGSSSSATADLFAKHGLTDDSYIVEAPSFIVPYIIEKSGEKNLKKFLDAEKENKEDDGAKKKKKEQHPAKKSEKKDGDVITVSEGEEEEEDEHEEDEEREEDSSESDANTAKSAKSASTPLTEGENYFETPLGKFFADIGLGLVQEFMQDDMLRIQKRRLAKGGRGAAAAAAAMAADSGMSVATLEKNLQVSRAKNQAYRLDKVHKCNLCAFKTESLLVLAHHREAPHIQGNRYLCNFCSMETREAAQALVHMLQSHGIRGRVEPHIFFHQCIFCPFEDHLKTKVTRHIFTCQKRFRPERNMEPPPDWEPPAKIPRMPNRAQKGLHGMGGAFNALGSSPPFGLTGKHAHLPSMVHPLLGKQHLNSMSLPPLIPANGVPQANSKSNRNNNFNTAAAAAAALAGMKLPSDKNSKGGVYRNSPLYLPSNYAVQGNIYQLMNSTGGVMPMLPNLPLLSKKAGSNAVSITPTPATLIPSLPLASSLSISGSSGGMMTATPMTTASSASKTGSRLPQQPSISITPLPRPSASSAGSSSGSSVSASAKNSSNTTAAMSVRAVSGGGDAATAAALGIKAGQPTQPGQKTNMVVCEICDSCIKDLEQLRNHMHWIHKVKIHPKMIHNRPPLNCQKCQFRFFTDQGLERHLLGSHGLVTSSMQESANKGQDGGRCPICGKVYQWKLLSHVAKDHGLTLKPAHLSYKCTVCTATFNMYKLFENHVYTAHSVVAKKVLDKKGGVDGTSARADSNHSGSGKSLKINDEITIIPQPARGPSQAANSSASSSSVSVSVSVSSVNKGDDAEKACQGCGQTLDRHKKERDYCSACTRKTRDPLREPSQEKEDDHGGSTRRRRRERKGEAVDVIDLSGEEDGGANNVPVRVPLGKSEITITKVKASSSSVTGGKHSGVQLIRLPEGVKSSAAAPLHAGDVEMTVSVSKVSQRKRTANEEVANATGKRSRHD